MVCSDTSRGRQSRCLALRSHELRAYCNFESKQAISITLFGRRLNNNILIIPTPDLIYTMKSFDVIMTSLVLLNLLPKSKFEQIFNF